MDFVIFIISMAALIYGADFVIKESEKIALHFNISHYVIGATLVAFGTSLPEMAASMMASYTHKSDMAVANVIGSIIFNISLVLGVVFLVSKKMQPKRNLFYQDSAWVIVPLIVFLVMLNDGTIDRIDGIAFLFLMGSYLFFLFSESKESLEIDEDEDSMKFNWAKTIILLGVGFVLTVGGANFVIQSATNIAHSFGVSEWIIGLLLISFGTSLPEFVVSVVAASKGNAEMSIGNIIGSNVANFSMVLGGSALINPLHVDTQAVSFDIFMLISISATLLFILANKLYNKSGGIFLLILLMLFIKHSI